MYSVVSQGCSYNFWNKTHYHPAVCVVPCLNVAPDMQRTRYIFLANLYMLLLDENHQENYCDDVHLQSGPTYMPRA